MKTIDNSAKSKSSKTIHRSVKDSSNANELANGDRAEIHQQKDEPIRDSRPTKPFPGDFQKHAHRFTRSFSWKTKPEESSFAHMQPLPKLIKRPGYTEICCKNVCWPAHQLCLCCGRNTAEGFRRWSKSTGEYDYNRACRSSCALCSDDAYKILNTPIVFKEKIIDPEVLLPLDAELLYYSIQSEKRQREKQQNSSAKTASPKRSKLALPFSKKKKSSRSASKKRKRKKSHRSKKRRSRSASKKRRRKKSRRSKQRRSRSKSRKSSRSRKRSRRKSKKRSRSKSKRSRGRSRRRKGRG